MNDNAKMISMLEQILESHATLEAKVDANHAEATANHAKLEAKVDEIKEELDEIRSGVNTLLNWADNVEHIVKVPLMEYA
jgi:ABC-type phosphate transport system auxiliary subunit